jgi:hypothetical protein
MKLKKISLSNVPLHSYQKYMQIEDPTEQDLLKCFLGLTQPELNKLPAKHVDIYLMQIQAILKQEHELIRTFKLNGIEYGFIPKLDDITYGENLDVTKYMNQYGSMHKAMAVLFRPIKQKIREQYLIEEYTGSYAYAEKLKQMPLDVVLGAIVFFYSLTNALMNSTLNYLQQQIQEDSTLQASLQKNGVDIQSSIRSLREMLQGLMPLAS